MKSRILTIVTVAAVATMIAGGAAWAAGKSAPEQGTWQYQEALETGKLPVGYFSDASGKSALAKGKDVVVEVGGRLYRGGIDTP
ncbi:MAG: hypothetical protein M1550_04525 [Deltaproteobacteria bacterium]|nr:hypothetical protein [Deltaproteobacteria bacterium]